MKEHAPTDLLRELRKDLRQMVHWLQRSLDMCGAMELDGDLSDEQYDALEALTSRYARASDIVFQRMLRCLDRIELESPGTLLDAIHRAEKRGFFRDERQARRLRELRNEIAHEYVTDNLVPLLKFTTEAAAELLEVMARIDQYSQKYEKETARPSEMKPIERMNAVRAGQVVDHWPFVPSIYEHGARLLDKSPGEVSRSAEWMAEAALAGFETYRHDLVTVGIDIYNIEAEAFGCRLSEGQGKSIPGVTSHPLAGGALDPSGLAIPKPAPGNRLGLIAEAVERVRREIGDEVWVYGCMGGPFSQAAELRGFENLIIDMHEAPERVHALLEKTAALATEQACRLAALGAGVNLFESWATLPLIAPPIYEQYVVPYNKRVIDTVRARYQTPPPAVILGGDTTRLIDLFIATGTGLIAADYLADIGFMREKIGDREIIIRGCVDPKMIEWGDWAGLEQMVCKLAEKAAGMTRYVWGCGCVSYDTPPEALLRFKEMTLVAQQ